MKHVVSNPEPYVGYGTQRIMSVTLTSRYTSEFVDLAFPDESGVWLDLRPY